MRTQNRFALIAAKSKRVHLRIFLHHLPAREDWGGLGPDLVGVLGEGESSEKLLLLGASQRGRVRKGQPDELWETKKKEGELPPTEVPGVSLEAGEEADETRLDLLLLFLLSLVRVLPEHEGVLVADCSPQPVPSSHTETVQRASLSEQTVREHLQGPLIRETVEFTARRYRQRYGSHVHPLHEGRAACSLCSLRVALKVAREAAPVVH